MNDQLERQLFEHWPRNSGLLYLDRTLAGMARYGFFRQGSHAEYVDLPAFSNGVKKYLEQQPDAAVLDLGAGDGNLSSHLAPVAHVTAVDKYVWPERKTHDNLRWIEHDLNNGFPNEIGSSSYDLVVMLFTSRYLEDPITLLNRCIKVTRKGGYIIMNGFDSISVLRDKTLPGSDLSFAVEFEPPLEKLEVYTSPSFNLDYCIFRVLDPEYQMSLTIHPELSHTLSMVKGSAIDLIGDSRKGLTNLSKLGIADTAKFVYSIDQ